jgi:hypothetical protein
VVQGGEDVTLWFIGMMFTAGYTGLFQEDPKMTPKWFFIALVMLGVSWPICLGHYMATKRKGDKQ